MTVCQGKSWIGVDDVVVRTESDTDMMCVRSPRDAHLSKSVSSDIAGFPVYLALCNIFMRLACFGGVDKQDSFW